MKDGRDPLGRDRQVTPLRKKPPPQQTLTETVDVRRLKVWKLRTEKNMSVAEIAKQFRVPLDTIYRDLNHQHDKVLAALGEYGQFRRRENERELEALKALYASYIFNPNVVIRGREVDADGKTRVIELSHFDAMLKVSTLYLAAMNIQNKMWGLYTVRQAKQSDAPGTMNIKNLSIHTVQELRQLAKRENLPLPSSS
jgi:transposase